MGLGGPRKRAKFSHDPNNTNWTRSEDKYGQRILQAQGWKPGDYLGAKNASHAKFHTDANYSHIKVALREENLGVGARVGAAGGEWATTGLGDFQDLLGRLNGKSEDETKKVQQGREAFRKDLYIERRWGTLRFVSGGLLVGDRVEEPNKESRFQGLPVEKAVAAIATCGQLEIGQNDPTTEESRSKRRKKLKKSREGKEASPLPIESDQGQVEENLEAPTVTPGPSSARDEKIQRRAEKAKRRLEKKARRQARAAAKEIPLTTVEPASKAEVPAPEILRGGIHTVRQRHIRQKKMAMMDSKALKEILMIKA